MSIVNPGITLATNGSGSGVTLQANGTAVTNSTAVVASSGSQQQIINGRTIVNLPANANVALSWAAVQASLVGTASSGARPAGPSATLTVTQIL
jgi:hypothetical protein